MAFTVAIDVFATKCATFEWNLHSILSSNLWMQNQVSLTEIILGLHLGVDV